MNKTFRGLMALSLAFILGACGGGKDANKDTDKDQKPETETSETAEPTDVSGKISVQVEEAWLPHYEEAAKRVKVCHHRIK